MSLFLVPGVWIGHPVLRATPGGPAEREAEDPAGSAHHRGEEDDPQPARKHQQMHLPAVPLALLRVLPQVPDVPLQALRLRPTPAAYRKVKICLFR